MRDKNIISVKFTPFFFLAVLLLFGCSTSPRQGEPEQSPPRQSPTPEPVLAIAVTEIEAATPTPTPSPYPTQTPSATAVPATSTPTPTSAPAITPTPFTASGLLLPLGEGAWSVAWSPDGQWIAAGWGAGRITLWEAGSGTRRQNLWQHSGFVHTLAFSPDGIQLASGSADGTIILWDTATGLSLNRLENFATNVWKIAWSPDGMALAVQRAPDPSVLLWDTSTWEIAQEFHDDYRYYDPAWSPDGGLLATGSTGHEIIFWDPSSGEQKSQWSGHADNVLQLAWSPDGNRLASRSLDNQLFIWDTETGTILQQHPTGRGIFDMAWAPDSNTLAYGSLHGPLVILDANTGEVRYLLNVDGLYDLEWSPDGEQLAAAASEGVWIWPISPDLIPTETPELTATSEAFAPATMIAPGDGRPMVLIPNGPFLMGAPPEEDLADADERPQHEVRLRSYWIDLFEVTHEAYAQCVQVGLCNPPAEFDINGFAYSFAAEVSNAPVVNVTWQDANDYCAYAGKRLPTEAEWEKAAHGETWQRYPWRDDRDPSGLAWFCEECIYDPDHPEVFDDFSRPFGVDMFPDGVSPYGLFNMAGNVWEWVLDWYGGDTYGLPDRVNPSGPGEGMFRVARGGSWTSGPQNLRTTYRNAFAPTTAWIDVGFRCAMFDD